MKGCNRIILTDMGMTDVVQSWIERQFIKCGQKVIGVKKNRGGGFVISLMEKQTPITVKQSQEAVDVE